MRSLGKVYLVGVEVGSPHLPAVIAVEAIRRADVILIDDHVDPAILSHACACARIVKVGKPGSCRPTPQEFIERLMIAEAHMGRCVVHLKSPPYFLFDRAIDERAHLQVAGMDVEAIGDIGDIGNGLAASASIATLSPHRISPH